MILFGARQSFLLILLDCSSRCSSAQIRLVDEHGLIPVDKAFPESFDDCLISVRECTPSQRSKDKKCADRFGAFF
jgi:hypothetical protein